MAVVAAVLVSLAIVFVGVLVATALVKVVDALLAIEKALQVVVPDDGDEGEEDDLEPQVDLSVSQPKPSHLEVN